MEKKIQIYALFIGMSDKKVYGLLKAAKGLKGHSFALDGEPPFDYKLAMQILADLQPAAAKKVKIFC